MKRIFAFPILVTIFFCFSFLSKPKGSETFIDSRDKQIYRITKIGDQVWMSENLRFKTLNPDSYEGDESNVLNYGYLYTWSEAQKLCPKGWHIPSKLELDKMLNILGGKNKAGGKLKSKVFWKSPNKFATNSSGFSANPSGTNSDGIYSGLNETSYYWSEEAECTSAYVLYLSYRAGFADVKSYPKTNKACIRCLKD